MNGSLFYNTLSIIITVRLYTPKFNIAHFIDLGNCLYPWDYPKITWFSEEQ